MRYMHGIKIYKFPAFFQVKRFLIFWILSKFEFTFGI